MNSTLLRTSLRYLLRHPWQVGLCVLGVALGVAVIVAIDLANASAQRAFELSTESVAGRATHQVVGGPSGLDEALYRAIRLDAGLRQSAPLIEGYVNAPALDGLTMQVLGVDPLAEAPFRSYLAGAGENVAARTSAVDLAAFMTQPSTALMAAETAARHSIKPGDALAVRIGGRTTQLRIVGLLQANDDLSRRALESLLIVDVATAQELFGSVGRLSRIDLILADDAQVAAVAALLPPGAELTRPATRSNALEQMTRAFELNLTALSLLALIVGMFLIYNTVTFSVVQRRALLGTLRCIGVTRRQVVGLVLLEALLISVIGTILGLLLGVVLGRGLVGLVTQTINDLYFVVTVRGLSIEPLVLLKGLLLGIGATLLSALIPAFEAGSTPPRTVLRRSSYEERIRKAAPFAALAGGALIGGALLLLAGSGSASSIVGLYLAFAALFAIVIGTALLTPTLTIGLMQLIAQPAGRLFGLLGRMAPRDVVASLSRTSVAVAALMVAVSVTIGVGIMVGSFRQTVIAWLEQSLVADVYISAPTNAANRIDTTGEPGADRRIGRATRGARRQLLPQCASRYAERPDNASSRRRRDRRWPRSAALP
jgi:putative ABC transport system permease protein